MWYAASWPPRSHWISLLPAEGVGLGVAGVDVAAGVAAGVASGVGTGVAGHPPPAQATAARAISSTARTRRTVSTAGNDSVNRANRPRLPRRRRRSQAPPESPPPPDRPPILGRRQVDSAKPRQRVVGREQVQRE